MATGGSLLSDLIGSLFERSRSLPRVSDGRPIDALCAALMSERAEVGGMVAASAVLSAYGALDEDGRLGFFRHLNDAYDVDAGRIGALAADYRDDPTPDAFGALMHAAEPGRQELLRRINAAPGATAAIVRMRADLLRLIPDHPELARTDQDFTHLLRSWFNRGFLVLRQITWGTGADILERIIAYEAVHQIETWDDLRNRLHPPDRRCFAFFHPAMPDDPLIFVEVALTRGVPSSIQATLDGKRKILSEDQADTAVFYSISNCQAGLAGISFGNSLIKQVVRDLSSRLPGLKTFVTLSPIPGLARWMADQDIAPGDGTALAQSAASYLLDARRPDGSPVDAVARFHLGNGARISAIHAGADTSAAGLKRSHGAMVNYEYQPDRIARNAARYAEDGQVAATSQVRGMARQVRARRSAD